MSSVNKVILVGNICSDPETRSFPNGGKVCNIRLATNESWKDKNTGERKERAEYHSISIYSEQIVRVAEQYLRKGSKVYIEGQLETRKWQDQSGQDRYTTEIALRPYRSELTMLDSKQGGQSDGQQSSYQEPPVHGGGTGDMEDGIPFNMEWR